MSHRLFLPNPREDPHRRRSPILLPCRAAAARRPSEVLRFSGGLKFIQARSVFIQQQANKMDEQQQLEGLETRMVSIPAPPTGRIRLAAAPSTGQNPPPSGSPASQESTGKRKPKRPPSHVWAHFSKQNDRANCNYCTKSYAFNSSNGTSGLLRHLKVCSRNLSMEEVGKKQKIIAFEKQGEDGPVTMKLVLP